MASFGLLMNWFGDSPDGSLARYRRVERPQFGFFLDHSMDAASNLMIAVGLGLSPYVDMGAALFTLVGYLLLGLSVFLSTHVSGQLRLSFLGFGPTELRLTMILFNLAVFLMGPVTSAFLGRPSPCIRFRCLCSERCWSVFSSLTFAARPRIPPAIRPRFRRSVRGIRRHARSSRFDRDYSARFSRPGGFEPGVADCRFPAWSIDRIDQRGAPPRDFPEDGNIGCDDFHAGREPLRHRQPVAFFQ